MSPPERYEISHGAADHEQRSFLAEAICRLFL
jgi:hypothetical protein